MIFFNSIYIARKLNIKLLIKVDSVIKSCQTVEQFCVSKKYANLIYKEMRKNIKSKLSFLDEFYYLRSMSIAINDSCKLKATELNVPYIQVIY